MNKRELVIMTIFVVMFSVMSAMLFRYCTTDDIYKASIVTASNGPEMQRVMKMALER